MIEGLTTARDLLRSALDQYLKVCLLIDKSYVDGCLPESTVNALMDGISDELCYASSYEKILRQAKAAIASTRNRSACIVPISRLPTDVLIQIFQLITAGKKCIEAHKNSGSTDTNHKYPSLLTRVCSCWRQVVICTKDLWTHVDMPWYFSGGAVTLARIEERITQAGSWPLDIHIIEPQIGNYRARTGLGAIARLFASISPQIRSLDLNLVKPPIIGVRPQFPVNECYSIILDTCLSNCRAGTLTRLSIRLSLENTSRRSGCYFLEASPSPRASPTIIKTPTETTIAFTLSNRGLEDLFLGITSLDLCGCYPRWVSKAYHNLFELRLGAGASISERELLNILSSSPRIRLLDFGLTMTNTSPDTHKVTPVLLAELETLITPKWSLEELGQFLRLIRPGSRPLSIALDMPNGYHSSASSFRGPPGLSIAKFLVSTNALTICITGSYHYWQVAFLVKMAPRARVLVLNKLDLGNTKPEKYTAVKETRHGPHLDDLYVVDTMISQSFLLWLIKVYHVRRLTITNDSKVTQGSDTIGKEQIYADISHLGCNFKSITSDEPYPMK